MAEMKEYTMDFGNNNVLKFLWNKIYKLIKYEKLICEYKTTIKIKGVLI